MTVITPGPGYVAHRQEHPETLEDCFACGICDVTDSVIGLSNDIKEGLESLRTLLPSSTDAPTE